MEHAAHRSRWARWPAFVVVALIGLALRLPQLGARPMHTDEAVNAYVVGELLGGEAFTYDPHDRHGPALAALALPLAKLHGAKSFSDLTEFQLRLTAVVAGTITILLFGAAAEIFGFLPSLIAALLFAVAPLPVYYDRYFIHESLFSAATFGLILSAWRALTRNNRTNPLTRQLARSRPGSPRTGFRPWGVGSDANSLKMKECVLAGACAALMLAAKETAILHFFALAAAALLFWLWNLRGRNFIRPLRPGPLLAAAGTFLLLLVILFTWFGRNWSALGSLFHAFPDVLARAGGQGHEKPFWYYGRLLTSGWSGGLLVALACLGLLLTIRKRDDSPYQFVAYYGLILAAIYSLIPYKTPWLALNLWLTLALFAAKAIDSLWRWAATQLPRRAAVPAFCILPALAGVLIAHDIRQRVFQHPADETNPYAYAHTSDDILGLSAEIQDLSRRNAITRPRIAVIASDPWPLPWYLRHFDQVGFWQPGQHVADADFYVTSTEAAGSYADQLRNFRPEFFGVRPGELILLWSPGPK